VRNVSCFGGSNGAITLTVSGGNQPYTFNWGNGITTQNRTGLAAGTYTISDAQGCSIVASQTLTQPTTALALAPTRMYVYLRFSGKPNAESNITNNLQTRWNYYQ